MPPMRLRIALVTLSLVVVAAFLLWKTRPRPQNAPKSQQAPTPLVHDQLPDIAAQMKAAGPAEAQSLLNRTFSKEAILPFLDSKADAPTHLGFSLAPDGSLREAPTLRTFLLDQLVKLDPAAAAVYAEKILSTRDSADERSEERRVGKECRSRWPEGEEKKIVCVI